jgi:hypothetical protein
VEIRIGRVATRLTAATQALDDLARRVLTEELPRQHTAHRQAALARLQDNLQTVREAEDALRSRAAELRDQQLALQTQTPARAVQDAAESSRAIAALPPVQESPAEMPAAAPAVAAKNERQVQLESLRLELARLQASFTDEHPQVLAIRRQIDSLEQADTSTEPRDSVDGPALALPPARAAAYHDLRGPEYVSIGSEDGNDAAAELARITGELTTVQDELSRATKYRDSQERSLQSTLATLAVNSPSAAWNAEPARIVARLGGTPRMLPVMLALLAAAAAGAVMFRATRVLALPRLLQTASDLAAALPIPLVGRNPTAGGLATPVPRVLITPARVRLVTKAGEAILLTILGLCVCAIFLDPTLALQFTDDPFGVLSEIVGRLLGR